MTLSSGCAGRARRGVDPLIGSVLAERYRVESRLGAGGMGVVYAARHEVTGREVAIKLLRPNVTHSDESIARFAREARTGAAIGHPNIVDVLDAGSLLDGTPFLVMERLDGEPLGALLGRERRLTLTRVSEIITQAAGALSALHARGVIHRDVKTDNLFVEPDGRVKLLDFGLALFTDASESARVTREGMFNGTPEYMPPEVFDGTEPNVSWDVYALATVAFELLTGVVPFEGASAMVTLYKKRESIAPRLGAVSEHGFSESLERVIRRGLERDPTCRPATPTAFAEELARVALGTASEANEGRSALLADVSSVEDEARPRRRARSRWARGAVLMGACGALLGLGWLAMAPSGPVSLASAEASATPEARAVPAPDAPMPAPAAPIAVAATTRPASMAEEIEAPTAGRVRSGHRPRHPTTALTSREARTDVVLASAHTQGRGTETDARELTREGTTALMRGMLPDAIELLRRATLAAPGSASAWRSLGLANERMGRTAEARRAYARYLELAPTARDVAEVRRRIDAL